jgi:hypothetical protein
VCFQSLAQAREAQQQSVAAAAAASANASTSLRRAGSVQRTSNDDDDDDDNDNDVDDKSARRAGGDVVRALLAADGDANAMLHASEQSKRAAAELLESKQRVLALTTELAEAEAQEARHLAQVCVRSCCAWCV